MKKIKKKLEKERKKETPPPPPQLITRQNLLLIPPTKLAFRPLQSHGQHSHVPRQINSRILIQRRKT